MSDTSFLEKFFWVPVAIVCILALIFFVIFGLGSKRKTQKWLISQLADDGSLMDILVASHELILKKDATLLSQVETRLVAVALAGPSQTYLQSQLRAGTRKEKFLLKMALAARSDYLAKPWYNNWFASSVKQLIMSILLENLLVAAPLIYDAWRESAIPEVQTEGLVSKAILYCITMAIVAESRFGFIVCVVSAILAVVLQGLSAKITSTWVPYYYFGLIAFCVFYCALHFISRWEKHMEDHQLMWLFEGGS